VFAGLLAMAAIMIVAVGSARQDIVDFLHWVKRHWLSAGALSVVVGILVPLLLYWLEHRSPKGAVEQAQDRTVMLRRVRFKWIADVLEPSLADAARLALGLERRSDVLDLGTRTRRQPGRSPALLSENVPIIEVFENAGSEMLILGAPGAGKTTLLLQLADQLTERAKHDPTQVIPVVLNLASWARERQPLDVWLAQELRDSYGVPPRIARAWIKSDALALLLDGLDEVAEPHRAACVETVNAYRQEHGLVPLVVCSRTRELEALTARLRLGEAVELQPPTDAQVEIYLGYLEETGTPLSDIRAVLAVDPALRELLHSPLMLHVVALAYHGQPATGLQEPGTLKERQARLWDKYLTRMFEQRPLDESKSGYTREDALRWLAWLAGALQDRNQTEFQLDRLVPEWLPHEGHWRTRAHFVTGVSVGLIVGSAAWLAFGLAFGARIGLAFGLAVGLLLGLDAGTAERRKRDIRPVEQVRWYWPQLFIGLVVGLVVGLVGGLVAALVLGFGGGLGFTLGAVLGGALIGGLRSSLQDDRAMPNEGIKRSAKHALRFGFAAALAAGLIGGLASLLGVGLAIGLGIGMAGAMVGGLAIGLVTETHTGISACLQHYAVRAELVHAKVAPWRYGSFLEAMTYRLLLHRNGSGYLFVHRLLREHLANSVDGLRTGSEVKLTIR
jgi:hypothetical protein